MTSDCEFGNPVVLKIAIWWVVLMLGAGLLYWLAGRIVRWLSGGPRDPWSGGD